jgi:glycosyltransferase involved in cell wall biosynthesis
MKCRRGTTPSGVPIKQADPRMKVSIVIPCYNEAATLPTLLEKVIAAETPSFEKEIVLVDDGSNDASPSIGRKFAEAHQNFRHVVLRSNSGKGSAIAEGLKHATGEVLLIQDADLEYDPADYRALLACFVDPNVKVVYGSRILGSSSRSYHRYYWGGQLLTWVTNVLYGSQLTDEPTGYKVFRREVLAGMTLTSRGFEFCPEVTAKTLRRGYAIHEVPIHYYPRSFSEGKKIRWTDGFKAIWTLLRVRFGRF